MFGVGFWVWIGTLCVYLMVWLLECCCDVDGCVMLGCVSWCFMFALVFTGRELFCLRLLNECVVL